MNLFIKECKNILKSMVYYIFIVVLVFSIFLNLEVQFQMM